MTHESAAARSAALLRQLDASRQQREPTTRVSCTEPSCRSELLCRASHADNLEASWRCADHRNTPSVTTTREDTP